MLSKSCVFIAVFRGLAQWDRLFVRDHRVEFVDLQCERGNYHPYAFYNISGS